MTFNVHLAQFDVAPTRTCAGISLICDYLINFKICDVTLSGGGDLRNVTTCDKDEGGVKKSWNSCDLIYGWPLIRLMSPACSLNSVLHIQFGGLSAMWASSATVCAVALWSWSGYGIV